MSSAPSRTSLRTSIALGLCMCGMNLGWAVRGFISGSKSNLFAGVPLVLGLLLLVEPKWLFHFPKLREPHFVSMLLLLVFVPIFALSFADIQLMSVQIIHMTAIVLFTILVALDDQEDFSYAPEAVLAVGGLACTYYLIEIAHNPVVQFARLATQGNDNPLAVALVGGVTTIAALVVGLSPGQSKWWGAPAAILFVFGTIVTLLSLTRSQIIAIPLCVAVYLLLRPLVRSEPRERRRSPSSAFVVTLIVLVAIVGVIFFRLGQKYISSLLWYFSLKFGSLANLALGNGPVETSASLHKVLLAYSWNNLTVLGHGIMGQSMHLGPGNYPHNIYLQSFYDFGLVGGLICLLTALVIPAAIIVTRLSSGSLAKMDVFIVLCYVNELIDHVTHETPYVWFTWQPIVMVYLLLSRPPNSILPKTHPGDPLAPKSRLQNVS